MAKKLECTHICADFDKTHPKFGRGVSTGSYALYGDEDPNFGYGEGTIIHGARCIMCKAQLPIGPANDADLNVQREIAAAAHVAGFNWDPPAPLSNAEADGYHHDENSPFRLIAAWDIGYLVRAAVDDDGEGYDWDVTRPHEGQLEEWKARVNWYMDDPQPDDPTCPACGEAPSACTAGDQSDVEDTALERAAADHLEQALAFDREHPPCAECEAPFGCDPGTCVKHPDLITFADGEATPEQAAATREHLASCESCGKELLDVMQLGARLSTLEPIDDRFGHAPDDPPEQPMPRCAKDGAMLVDGECTVCKWNGTVEV